MRAGRLITAGTMAMGAYRAYRRFKGNQAAAPGKGRRNPATTKRQAGGIGGLLGRR